MTSAVATPGTAKGAEEFRERQLERVEKEGGGGELCCLLAEPGSLALAL